MNAASILAEEQALRIPRLAQPEQVGGAIHVLVLEVLGRHCQILRNPGQILLGDVDIAFHVATFHAPALAFKMEFGHARYISFQSNSASERRT